MTVGSAAVACRYRPWVAAPLALLLVGVPLSEGGATTEELAERFDARVEARRDALIELRRDLHRHPELSGDEVRTAGTIASRLEALGLDVRRGVGGHGVVATLRGGAPGPVAAFRADMDAFRSSAPDPVPFASTTSGVRHICGHDIHTTIGMALAEGFASIRTELAGTLVFFFQPAEETGTGARAMIDDGALDEVKPDGIFAFHTAPFEVGQVATSMTTLMPARDRASIAVEAEPGAELARAADTLRSRLLVLDTVSDPTSPQPADSDFVYAALRQPERSGDRAMELSAVFTVATESARRHVSESLEREARRLEEELPGIRAIVSYEPRWIAGVQNAPELVRPALEIARAHLGDDGVVTLSTVVPAFSEDFGSFQEKVPGVLLFLGVSNSERGTVGMPHTPDYVANEEAIFVGAGVMGRMVLDFLTSR